MAEAVRPKKRVKKKTHKARPAAPSLEEDIPEPVKPQLVEEKEESPAEKCKEEDVAGDAEEGVSHSEGTSEAKSREQLNPQGDEQEGEVNAKDSEIKCESVTSNPVEDGQLEIERTEIVEGRNTDEDDGSGDMDMWMEEHEGQNAQDEQTVSLEKNQEGKSDEEFQEAVESLGGVDKEGESAHGDTADLSFPKRSEKEAASILVNSNTAEAVGTEENAEEIDTASVAPSTADITDNVEETVNETDITSVAASTAKALEEDKAIESDVKEVDSIPLQSHTPEAAETREEDTTMNDDNVLRAPDDGALNLVVPSAGQEQPTEGSSNQEEAMVMGDQEIEEGPHSLGWESIEEFEVLSPLSRETSVEEASSATVPRAENAPLKEEQASAPPAEEVFIPESSAPPEETSDSITTATMISAPMIAVAPDEDPLSLIAMPTPQISEEQSEMMEHSPVAVREIAPSRSRKNLASRGRATVWPTQSMQPMSRGDLQHYYFNSMLAKQDAFVEDFVKGNYIDKHEFYDLVNNYLRARVNAGTIQAEVTALRKQYIQDVGLLWSFEEEKVQVKGQCQDDVNVKGVHTFKIANYHEEKLKLVDVTLTQLRTLLHGTSALVTYTAQLSQLQIEVYLYLLQNRSPLLRGVDDTASLTAHVVNPHSSEAQADTGKLRQCIAVLFAFQRKPVTDTEFIDNSRAWLKKLIAILLRVATLEDHLFIFNHLLRCPPGISNWAAPFLQVVAPRASPSHHRETLLLGTEGDPSLSSSRGLRSHGIQASSSLDHFVNMLATLMNPVRYREEFLAKMKATMTNTSSPSGAESAFNWTLVDEDLESEDDESSHSLLLNESDLVELLAQFPFKEMFSCVLGVDSSADKMYSIEQVESQDMLRLVAFSSTLIDIFHTGLQTFSRSRYRQFVKRIGRFIRHTVQYVADHWSNYRAWRLEVCGDSESSALPSADQQRAITLQQIQLEVDEMFFRAVQCIMSTPRLGTWQFLADMPYACLSPHMMWRLLWFLHHSDKGEVSSSASISARSRAKLEEYKWDLSDPVKKADFGNKLFNMPMSEVIYLLTTFANMASSRSNKETDFVESITTEVYELAYLNTHTRDSCSKVGRELLAGMALTHPFILTNILGLIRGSMGTIGAMSVYLCSELPLHLWLPSMADLTLLRGWLLDQTSDCTENQLARLILSKLNWGYNEQEDGLILDISLHRKVAILVMEAFSKHIMEKQQGGFITSTLSWGISMVMGDVLNLDVWCWDLLNKLRLHAQDQPTPVMATSDSTSGGHATKAAEAAASGGQQLDGGSLSGRDFVPCDLTSDPNMYPVNKALGTKTPLACYIAVAMTTAGHNLEDFLSKGLEYLQNLVTSGCYRMCIPLIGKVVPTFLKSGQQEYLLTNVKFISLIETILNADLQYSRILQKLSMSFHTECTALFSSMIATLLQSSKTPSCPPGTMEALFEFWLTALTSCRSWHTNRQVCQVLDVTLSGALVCHKASSILTQEVFMTHFRKAAFTTLPKKNTSGSRAPGLLSSMLSLVSPASSSTSLPSMLEPLRKEFSWLAFSLSMAETEFLRESGLLQVVSQELHGNPSMTPDLAVKRANQRLKSSLLANAYQLPIYRWAQLALDSDLSHPILPVIWQMFFTLYLERVRAEEGTLQRFSIGLRYFQAHTDLALQKSLKRQLARSADYHHHASQGRFSEGHQRRGGSEGAEGGESESENDAESGSGGGGGGVSGSGGTKEGDGTDFNLQASRELHIRLLKLYQTYLLWLEEPLLHDATLYLPSLPEQYDREKLARIFNGDMEPWMDYVDWDEVGSGVDRLVTQWLHVTRPASYNNTALSSREQEIEATTQILGRLCQYDTPQPAPMVPELVPPIKEVPPSMLANHQAMLEFIRTDLMEMVAYANSFSTRESVNVALDLGYIELLPTLYHNSEIETRLEIPCKPTLPTRHHCLGPAKVVVRHLQCTVSEAIKRKLEENRSECKQLTIETEAPPPHIICTAAVNIENVITELINVARVAQGEEKEALNQVGVALLYYLANCMDDQCSHYPPTRQFFTSCIEILGQEFVRPYAEQAQPLLHKILTNHKLAGILAPNFHPCSCPTGFVHMYTEVVRATANNLQDLAFMLLTKFDLGLWLDQHHPTHTTGSQLIGVIGEALMACGGIGEEVTTEDSKPIPHYEVYRSHLQTMFMYNFPQHYADVMQLVIKGMEEKHLRLAVLHDVLKALDCPRLPDFGDVGQKQVEKLVQDETLLSLNELRESLEWLGHFFSQQRHRRSDLLQFGLYSHWKAYMPALSSFLGYLALNYVLQEAKRLQDIGADIEQGIKALWELVLSFFAPWIGPAEVPSISKPGATQVLPAWSEGDVDSALVIVTLFAETTSFMQALFHTAQQPVTTNVLTLFWAYYTRFLAKKGQREDILYAYHRAMATLPWPEFYPDVHCMEAMIKMYEDGQESCLLFLASIFPRIQWVGLLECLVARGDLHTTNQFLSALLSMLIIFGNSPNIMQTQGASLMVLIAEAHQLPWYLLDESCYHSATMWQLKKSNPRLVLEEQSVSTVLSLMRSVAGVGSPEPLNPRLSAKQSAYIGLVVGLMCQCSQSREVRGEQFTAPLHGLLYDVTIIATSAGASSAERSGHVSSLLTTVLSLLNGCSPVTAAPEAIVRGLACWLQDCPNSALVLRIIAAACNTLASTRHMAAIIEACIDSYFATATPTVGDLTHGWSGVVGVLQVPQLSHDEFLAQCLESGAYLTLYAYLSQRLPQCRSLEEEAALHSRLVDWCSNCKPSRENEHKLLLWWYKALEVSIRLVSFGTPEWTVARSLNNLTPAIMALGEDRRSSGILGALGFGKQSQLSFRFRLAARSLAVFIMAQLPKEGVRMTANAPGALIYPPHSRGATSPKGVGGSGSVQQGMKLLDSALENRSYLDLKTVTEYVRGFVLDSRHCLPDSLPFLAYLVSQLFPERACLNVVCQRNASANTAPTS